MDDKELIERAAKAAGLTLCSEWDSSIEGIMVGRGDGDLEVWNPLDDDGDALRLAVKLHLGITTPQGIISVYIDSGASKPVIERYTDDPLAATRRAIVRAAAAMADNQGGV